MRIKLHVVFFLTLLCGLSNMDAQPNLSFINDSLYQSTSDYYDYEFWEEFLDTQLPDTPVEWSEFDYNLYYATVFYLLNQFREQGSTYALSYHLSLERSAFWLMTYLKEKKELKAKELPDLLRRINRKTGFNGAYCQYLSASVLFESNLTYRQLAEETVQAFAYLFPLSLRKIGYNNTGLYVDIDKESNLVNVHLLMGGYRFEWLKEEE